MDKREVKFRGSPIRHAEFLDHLDQLAKEAARVRFLVEEVVEATLGPVETGDYLSDLFERRELLRYCGQEAMPEDREPALQLYWNTQRLYVAAQFSGFSLDRLGAVKAGRQNAIKAILATFEQPCATSYWGLRLKNSKPPRDKFRRAFTLLSLFSVVLPRRGQISREADETLKTLKENLIDDVVTKISKDGPPLRVLSVLKLLRRVDISRFEELRLAIEGMERDLNKELALLLAHEDTSGDDVARMVRVLCGRYLNPGLQIDPAQNALFSRAAEHVLKKCNRAGSWTSQEGKWRESAYLPLVRVLDLPNSILMPSIGILAETVTDALGTLKRRLSGIKVSLAQRSGPGNRPKPFLVNRAISDGLMLSAAVDDRMRDLLSDAELDEMGAEVPTKFAPWETLPNSLGFINNVNDGVIDLWKRRSEKRPGAILIFGPPGTGKTTIAKSLLCELNSVLRTNPGEGTYEEWRFLALSPADFARDGADRIIASAEKLFRKLQRVRRCVVLLDEMEEFLRVRGPGSSQESRLITTAFLPLLQETVEKRELILIVATNFVGNIDPAVTRRGRFDLVLPLGPPDKHSRAKIIEDALDPKNQSERTEAVAIDLLAEAHKKDIVEYTMGYTRDEVIDYVSELRSAMLMMSTSEQTKLGTGAERPELDKMLKEKLEKELKTELWRIRQERVPMALSGNPGCNWRTFRDEAARFKRGADIVSKDDTTKEDIHQGIDSKYWDDPPMPDLS
jgi:DNA polymerase III delta prime subunit